MDPHFIPSSLLQLFLVNWVLGDQGLAAGRLEVCHVHGPHLGLETPVSDHSLEEHQRVDGFSCDSDKAAAFLMCCICHVEKPSHGVTTLTVPRHISCQGYDVLEMTNCCITLVLYF